ncbi:Uncharacterised protein [Mycobacteroides abscessus subsp. abscessus]|uniref:hypothetical protein n=1 Tax=Mycobacteroides abscessus TaxID=36809 RepID=UPI0009278CC8|nr:hypothetical protein [Mycobacteroides abscessus]SHZ37870.1 Uncharacterised protein [Mycobacteroides abscessus subsp. abscessus]SHZ39787.1 Uncharacterised protein [Mycobacteroides abscessus subsp. abscessus]
MTKEVAKAISAQEEQTRKQLAQMHRRDAEMAKRAKKNGYDPTRPNHFFHDAAGDPSTCTENHNHPVHISEEAR